MEFQTGTALHVLVLHSTRGDLEQTCTTTTTMSSSPSVGNLYGMSSNGYPEAFGYRISQGTVPDPISSSTRPLFSWGYDDPFTGRYGPGAGVLTNIGTYDDTSVGATAPTGSNYERCLAKSPVRLTPGTNMLLEWPTLDLTDSSIAKVELNSTCGTDTTVPMQLLR